MRWFLGAEPLFRIPAVGLVQPAELLAYATLGIVGAFAAVFFAKAIGYLRPRLRACPVGHNISNPMMAAVVIGLIGFLGAPQVMGAGYEYIDQANARPVQLEDARHSGSAENCCHHRCPSLAARPGGMFAPTLFVGAMLGGAIGGLERIFFPALTGSTGTYALVGMGVLFAGFLRAPMTSVFMVLEVSGNYSIIVPVIVANTLAYVISRAFSLHPFSTFLPAKTASTCLPLKNNGNRRFYAWKMQ